MASRRRMSRTAALATLSSIMIMGFSISTKVQATSTWSIGDVFVAAGGGSYNVYSGAGVLKETISQGLSGDTAGCAFDGAGANANLYTTNFTNTKVVAFSGASPHGVVAVIDTDVASPGGHSESIVFGTDGSFFVGHADGDRDLHKYSPAGTLLQKFNVAVDRRGSDWLDLAANLGGVAQTTMLYTSEGRQIKRFNVGAGTQLADFATLPSGSTALALRLLSPGNGAGGLIVAAGANVKRLNAAGQVVQTYDAQGENDWSSLALDQTGARFWAGDHRTRNLYRFNVRTGAKEIGPINTGARLVGICVKGELTAAQTNVPSTLVFNPMTRSASASCPLGNSLTFTFEQVLQSFSMPVVCSEVPPQDGFCPGVGSDDLDCRIPQSPLSRTAIFSSIRGNPVVWRAPLVPTFLDPDTGLPASNHVTLPFKVFEAWTQPASITNPRLLTDPHLDAVNVFNVDLTSDVIKDPGEVTDGFGSEYVAVEQQLQGGGGGAVQFCGFHPPAHQEDFIVTGNVTPFKFRAAAPGGNCLTGPFSTTIIPRLSIALIVDGTIQPRPVVSAGGSGFRNFFRLTGDTWSFNQDNSGDPNGRYSATVFDDASRMAVVNVHYIKQ